MVAPSVLVIGDRDERLDRIFRDAGLDVVTGDAEAPELIATRLADGGDSLRGLRRRHPDAELLLLVPFAEVAAARGIARSLGADVIALPPDRRRTLDSVRRALQRQAERTRHHTLVERTRRVDAALAVEIESLARHSEEQRRELDEAVRLRSSFIANISHEIRTPVTVMQGMLEMLADDLGTRLSPDDRDTVEQIRVCGENLIELVQGILDLSKADAGVLETRPARIYVPDFIADLTRSVEPLLAGKPVRLVVDLPRGIEWLTVDGPKLRRLVGNLLSNAAKFTDRGEIRLAVRLTGGGEDRNDGPETLLRTPAPTGDTLEIVISDSGCGIPAADQELIFEAFRQVDLSATREHEGIGIGLTLVREMARLLGASIELESRPGEGTTFRVRLPVTAVETGTPPAAPLRRGPALPRTRGARDLASELARLFRTPVGTPEDAIAFALDFVDRVVQPHATCVLWRTGDAWRVLDSLGCDGAGDPATLPVFAPDDLRAAADGRQPARANDDGGREWWLVSVPDDDEGKAILASTVGGEETPDAPILLSLAARWLGFELERKRLLRERGDLLAVVGRDVKTPLGTLLAYTQSLLRNLCGPISTEQRAVVLRLERTIHRVILSTLDLLDYERARHRGLTAAPRSFSLAKVLEHLLSRHMAAIELGDYRVQRIVPADLPACLGDEIRTDRSISNLLRALLERLPPSSEIRIQASADTSSVRCDISATPSDIAPFLDGLGRDARAPEIGETLGLRITRAGIESQGGRVELLQGADELTVRLVLPRDPAG